MSVAHALQKLLPAKLPPSLAARPGNLYQVLSRAPGGGVGRRVYQKRWAEKQIFNCFWQVTRTRFKLEGMHGKAWGKLYWKGKLVSQNEERIRGALKYKWNEGVSGPTRQPTNVIFSTTPFSLIDWVFVPTQ